MASRGHLGARNGLHTFSIGGTEQGTAVVDTSRAGRRQGAEPRRLLTTAVPPCCAAPGRRRIGFISDAAKFFWFAMQIFLNLSVFVAFGGLQNRGGLVMPGQSGGLVMLLGAERACSPPADARALTQQLHIAHSNRAYAATRGVLCTVPQAPDEEHLCTLQACCACTSRPTSCWPTP